MSVAKAIYEALAAEPAVTGFLSVYGAAPAIFSRRPIPDDAQEPYILIAGPLDTQSRGTFDDPDSILDEQRDIQLIAPATGSVAPLDTAAQAMREALRNRLLIVPGRRQARCTIVNGPRDLAADSDTYGRLLTINVHLVT